MKLLRVLSSKDLDEINEFLGELKDGDEYKKRLKVLEDRKKEINALIEVVGKVNEIDALHLKARQLKEGADVAVAAAVADRAEAIKEVAAKRAASDADIASKNRAATKQFADREQALDAGEKALDKREKDHLRSLDNLAAREADVSRDIESAMAIRTKYTEAVASLKTAIEKTAKAL